MSAAEVVYSIGEVREGDVIAYPGRLSLRCRRNERDWFLVTWVEPYRLLGMRTHPQDWELGMEYEVLSRQVAANGVEFCTTEAEKPLTPSSSSDRCAVLRPPTPEGGERAG